MRGLMCLVVGLLPPSRVKNAFLRLLGHEVARSARLHPILLMGGARIVAGEGARIGALTAFRGAQVTLGEGAELGQLNWISSASFLVDSSSSPLRGQLVIGVQASVTNRHYFDVSGGVTVGDFATVAGVRSTFMTHGIDVASNRLTTEPISVGEYAMVGGNASLVLGASVPARSVVGMGAVVIRGLVDEGGLYVGNPARLKRSIDLGEYGRRESGKVPALHGVE